MQLNSSKFTYRNGNDIENAIRILNMCHAGVQNFPAQNTSSNTGINEEEFHTEDSEFQYVNFPPQSKGHTDNFDFEDINSDQAIQI